MENTIKRSPEEILDDQITKARQSTIQDLHKPGSINHTSETGTEGREEKRLKKKYLNELEGLVQRMLEARAELEDPDGQEAADKLTYFNNQWLTRCKYFNKRPRARFTLRPEAFMDRAEYYLNLEKEQIKAAKEAYQKSLFDKWFRRTWIDMACRRKWYRFKAKFVKKTMEEQFRAYWDRLEALPNEATKRMLEKSDKTYL